MSAYTLMALLMLLVALATGAVALYALHRVGALHGDWLTWKDAPRNEGVSSWPSTSEKHR